tara:strand:+ start:532 stop:714 length:183 start_codon:yes stop_codon:yes gene_type:complete
MFKKKMQGKPHYLKTKPMTLFNWFARYEERNMLATVSTSGVAMVEDGRLNMGYFYERYTQ